jgi:hypothetical protein
MPASCARIWAELHPSSHRPIFPEEDDTHRELLGANLKANEFLNRRLTVKDAAEAHVLAHDRALGLGFEIFVLSAPTPFLRSEAAALKRDAQEVDRAHFRTCRNFMHSVAGGCQKASRPVYDASRIATRKARLPR